MNLKGIISISGKPGLFKVVSQGKNSLIVESMLDKKRFPAFAANKISALEDISMYTEEDDVPLSDVMQKIYDKEAGKACPVANGEASEQHAYFESILPNYDKERVYNSDLKKLFNWYNLLQSAGELDRILEEEKKAAAEEKKAAKEEKVEKAEKKATKEKSAEEKPAKEKKDTKEKKETKAKKPKTEGAEKKKVATKTTAAKTNSKAKTTVKTASTKRGA